MNIEDIKYSIDYILKTRGTKEVAEWVATNYVPKNEIARQREEAIEDFARYLRDNFKLDNLELKGRWTMVDFLPYAVKYLSQREKGE